MKSRTLIASLFIAALSLFVIRATAQHSEHSQGGMMSRDRMTQHQQMMSQHQEMGESKTGHGMMGMGHDSATMAPMGVIHELFINHDRITRSVANLPDGIRTVTESDDPRIRQLLRDHVATMRQRVDTGNDPGLPIESEALRSIFQNYDKIETKVETTDKGVVVVQTSTDQETIAALQQHASEVTGFVKEGMAAMHAAMMKNGGGMMRQMSEHSMMTQHGERAMGFSQTDTTHHFLLTKDGGVIQVEANDPKDKQNRDLIRAHLTHIAQTFAAGDFSDPLAVHDKYPDGVPVMQRLRGDIRYTFEETPQGGRVLIRTTNPQALDAIHQFLRFQVREHETGDSVNVNSNSPW